MTAYKPQEVLIHLSQEIVELKWILGDKYLYQNIQYLNSGFPTHPFFSDLLSGDRDKHSVDDARNQLRQIVKTYKIFENLPGFEDLLCGIRAPLNYHDFLSQLKVAYLLKNKDHEIIGFEYGHPDGKFDIDVKTRLGDKFFNIQVVHIHSEQERVKYKVDYVFSPILKKHLKNKAVEIIIPQKMDTTRLGKISQLLKNSEFKLPFNDPISGLSLNEIHGQHGLIMKTQGGSIKTDISNQIRKKSKQLPKDNNQNTFNLITVDLDFIHHIEPVQYTLSRKQLKLSNRVDLLSFIGGATQNYSELRYHPEMSDKIKPFIEKLGFIPGDLYQYPLFRSMNRWQ